MSPIVSVIIPVYNAQEYLGQCLDTILMQTLSDIEVICVDTGSTDNTLSILKMYTMIDERLKVIIHKNIGIASARNKGIEESKGKFLIFLDSKNFYEIDMLEDMVVNAEKNSSDITICGYTIFDERQQKDIFEVLPSLFTTHSPIHPINIANEILNFSGSIWNKLFKRSLIVEKGLKFGNLSVCNDFNFIYGTIALSHNLNIISRSLIHCRLNLLNNVLIVELNKCHCECLPGYIQYFVDLGYNVDVLINEWQKIEEPLEMFNHLNIHYLSENTIINYLNSKQLDNYDICFFNSNIIYSHNCSIFDLIKIPLNRSKTKILCVEHRLENLEYLKQKATCIVLKKFNQDRDVFEINPHYFGKIGGHIKNEIVNFIVVGNIENKRKNYSLLISGIKELIHQGITNFKITVVGRGELNNIPKEIQPYFDIKGRLSYPDMYDTVHNADYFLTLLDPEDQDHNRYIKSGTSGSFQLIYGFNIPPLIADKFAKVYGFTDKNSIVYNTNEQFLEAIKKAIDLPEKEYNQLKINLKKMSAKIYYTSLKNLENALKKHS